MPYLYYFLTLLLATKALGGSFNAVFEQLGWSTYHGPVLGGLLGILISWGCVRFRPQSPPHIPARPSRLAVTLFVGLYLLLVGFGVFKRVEAIHHTPYDIKAADNLPAVIDGLNDVMQGKSPYHPRMLPEGHFVPHYYLPVLWLGYLPFHAAGIDVRFWNLCAHLLLYLLLLDVFLRSPQANEETFGLSGLFLLLAVGLHVFSKASIRDLATVQHGSFWITYSLFLWSVAREKFAVTRIAIPLVMLSRELGIVLLLPYGVYLWHQERARFWGAFRWALGIGLALTLPFLIHSPGSLFMGARHYAGILNQIPTEVLLSYWGLCGVLKQWDVVWLHTPLECLGLAIAIWLGWREKQPFAAAALGGLAQVVFILFTSITFGYLFTEPLILTYFMLVLGSAPELPERLRTWRRPGVPLCTVSQT